MIATYPAGLYRRTCQPGHHRWDVQAMSAGPDEGAQVTYFCDLCAHIVHRPMQADEAHAMAQLAQARLALQEVLARLNDGLAP